jgi:hypothetical protein
VFQSLWTTLASTGCWYTRPLRSIVEFGLTGHHTLPSLQQGVDKDVDAAQLRTPYRKLVTKHHLDRGVQYGNIQNLGKR